MCSSSRNRSSEPTIRNYGLRGDYGDIAEGAATAVVALLVVFAIDSSADTEENSVVSEKDGLNRPHTRGCYHARCGRRSARPKNAIGAETDHLPRRAITLLRVNEGRLSKNTV
jgi:hypothetical protein